MKDIIIMYLWMFVILSVGFGIALSVMSIVPLITYILGVQS